MAQQPLTQNIGNIALQFGQNIGGISLPVQRVLHNIYNSHLRPHLCLGINNFLIFKSDSIAEYMTFIRFDNGHDLNNDRGCPFNTTLGHLISGVFAILQTKYTLGIQIPYRFCSNGNGANRDFAATVVGNSIIIQSDANDNRPYAYFNPNNRDYYNNTNGPLIEYVGDKIFGYLFERTTDVGASQIQFVINNQPPYNLFSQELYTRRIFIVLGENPLFVTRFGCEYICYGNVNQRETRLRALLHLNDPTPFTVDNYHTSSVINVNNRHLGTKLSNEITWVIDCDVPFGPINIFHINIPNIVVPRYTINARAMDAATPNNNIPRIYPYFYPCCSVYTKVFDFDDIFRGVILIITHLIREYETRFIDVDVYFVYCKYTAEVDLDHAAQNEWIETAQNHVLDNLRIMIHGEDQHQLMTTRFYQSNNNIDRQIPHMELIADILPNQGDLFTNVGNNNNHIEVYVFKIRKNAKKGVSVKDIRMYVDAIFKSFANNASSYMLNYLTNQTNGLYNAFIVNNVSPQQNGFLINLTKVAVIIFALSRQVFPVIPNNDNVQHPPQQFRYLLPSIINSGDNNRVRLFNANAIFNALRDPDYLHIINQTNDCLSMTPQGVIAIANIQNIPQANIGLTYQLTKFINFVYVFIALIKRQGDHQCCLDNSVLQNTLQNNEIQHNQPANTVNNRIVVTATHDVYLQKESKNFSASFYDVGTNCNRLYLGPSAYEQINNVAGNDAPMVIDEIHGNEEDDMNYVEINNRKRGRSMDNYPDVDDDVNNDIDNAPVVTNQRRRITAVGFFMNAFSAMTQTVVRWVRGDRSNIGNTGGGGGEKITVIPLTDIADIIKILFKNSDEIYIFQISQQFIGLLSLYYYYSLTDKSVKDEVLRIFLEKICKISSSNRPNTYLNDRIISYLLESQKIDLLGDLMFLSENIKQQKVIPREFIDKHEMLISIFSGYEFLYNGPENHFLQTTPKILETTQIFNFLRLMHINTSKKIDHFDTSLGDKLSDMEFCLKVIHCGIYEHYKEETIGAISYAYGDYIFSKDGIEPEYPSKVKEIKMLLSSLSAIKELLQLSRGNLYEIDNISQISSVNTLLLMVDNILSVIYYYSCTGEILQPPIFDSITNLVANFYRLLCDYFDGIEINRTINTLQMNKIQSYTKNTQSPFLDTISSDLISSSLNTSSSSAAAGGKSYKKNKYAKKHHKYTKKNTKRLRKTRKITKPAKYIKKNVTKHRR